MLEINDIHTYYGKSYVIQGVSLRLEKGSLVAIMGRNGMGKTTLIRSIVGFAPARRGQIIFKGKNITDLPTYEIARFGIGLVPQGRLLFPSISVREHLQIAMKERADGWDEGRILSLFPRLADRLSQKADKLSGGEGQMLAIARGLVGNPDLLLLDEPSEGLAPLLVREVTQVLAKLKATGLSILLVEPNLRVVRKLADYVYIMSQGTIVHESTPERLFQASDVKSRYLGL